jgi:hypothetical protein
MQPIVGGSIVVHMIHLHKAEVGTRKFVPSPLTANSQIFYLPADCLKLAEFFFTCASLLTR